VNWKNLFNARFKIIILIIVNIINIIFFNIDEYAYQYVGNGFNYVINKTPSYVNHPGVPVIYIVSKLIIFLNIFSIDLKLSIVVLGIALFIINLLLIFIASIIINKKVENSFYQLLLIYTLSFPLFFFSKISPYSISYGLGAIMLAIIIFKNINYNNFYFYFLSLIFSIAIINLTFSIYFLVFILIHTFYSEIKISKIIKKNLLFTLLTIIFYLIISYLFFNDYLVWHLKKVISYFLQYILFNINLYKDELVWNKILLISPLVIFLSIYFYKLKKKNKFITINNICLLIFITISLLVIYNIIKYFLSDSFSIIELKVRLATTDLRYIVPILPALVFYRNKINVFIRNTFLIFTFSMAYFLLGSPLYKNNLTDNDSQFDKILKNLINEDKIENIFVSQELKKSLQVFHSEIFFYINLKEAGNYDINFLNFTIPSHYNEYLNKNISYLFFNEHLYNKQIEYNENKYVNIKKIIIKKLNFFKIQQYLVNKYPIIHYKYKYTNLCLDQLKNVKNFSLLLKNKHSEYNSEITSTISACNYLIKTKEYKDNFIIISYLKKK
jgi:hypothetical protein